METQESTKKLSEEQLELFDQVLLGGSYLEIFLNEYSKYYKPDEAISILDVGGGNGEFADSLLNAFPNITVTVLDNSEYLLSKNKENPRKKVILGSAETPTEFLGKEKFDLITINWVLHHLVKSKYKDTITTIQSTIQTLANHLNPNGKISIVEHTFNGYIFPSLPSFIIHKTTSTKNPLLLPITKKNVEYRRGWSLFFIR